MRFNQHLKGREYSWATSAFYFGYLAASYPASFLMVRLPLGKYLAVTRCVDDRIHLEMDDRLTPRVV